MSNSKVAERTRAQRIADLFEAIRAYHQTLVQHRIKVVLYVSGSVSSILLIQELRSGPGLHITSISLNKKGEFYLGDFNEYHGPKTLGSECQQAATALLNLVEADLIFAYSKAFYDQSLPKDLKEYTKDEFGHGVSAPSPPAFVILFALVIFLSLAFLLTRIS